MLFTEAEQEFLRSQRLARLATVGPTGWPHVVPVMYKLTDAARGSPQSARQAGRMSCRSCTS